VAPLSLDSIKNLLREQLVKNLKPLTNGKLPNLSNVEFLPKLGSIFGLIKDDGHMMVNETLRQTEELLDANRDKIERCYNKTVGPEREVFLSMTIRELLRKWKKFNNDAFVDGTGPTLKKRFMKLVRVFRTIGLAWLECVIHKEPKTNTTLFDSAKEMG